ncbi:MAG: PH domain-containing protein [Angustibacter sp.]
MGMITPGAPRRRPGASRMPIRRVTQRPPRVSDPQIHSMLSPAGVRTVQKYLLQSERPVIATRRHWVVIVEPLLSVFGALVVLGMLATTVDQRLGLIVDAAVIAALIVAGRLFWEFIEWRKDWFVVTDERLLLTSGILTRKVAVMPLTKVTDLSYKVSVAGRVFGYGQFVFETAGQDQALRSIDYLPGSHHLFEVMSEELFGESGIATSRKLRPARPASDD